MLIKPFITSRGFTLFALRTELGQHYLSEKNGAGYSGDGIHDLTTKPELIDPKLPQSPDKNKKIKKSTHFTNTTLYDK